MHVLLRSLSSVLGIALCVLALAPPTFARTNDPTLPEPSASAAHADGQRDFDFMIGTWKARLKRLDRPLTGSGTWTERQANRICTLVRDEA